MTQHLQRLGKFFFLSGALLLFNCQTEDVAVTEHNHQEAIKLSSKSIDDLLKEQQFNTAFSSLPKDGKTIKTSLEGKTAMEEEFGFTIVDQDIKIVNVDGNVSYSLLIARETETPGIVENLIIEIDDTGVPMASIVKYIVPSASNPFVENKPAVEGVSEIIPLNYDPVLENRMACVTITFPNCRSEPYCGGAICGYATISFCAGSYNPFTPITVIADPEGGGANGGGPNHGGGSGVPVNPNIPDQNPPLSIAQHLKKLSSSPNYDQSIAYLKAKANGSKEYAWAYKYFSNSSSFAPPQVVGDNQKDPNKVNLLAYTGGDYIGAMHNHPFPLAGEIPMFSPGDIRWLFRCATKHTPAAGQQKDYNAYFVLLVVGSGTYALKIKDSQKFMAISPKYEKLNKELVYNYTVSGHDASATTLQKDLLNVLKANDIGVGLYQEIIVNGVKVWHELSLNPNNANSNPILTPLN